MAREAVQTMAGSKVEGRSVPKLPEVEGRYWELERKLHVMSNQSLGATLLACPIDGNFLYLFSGRYDDGCSEHSLHCLACLAEYDTRDKSPKALQRQARKYLSEIQQSLPNAREQVARLESVIKAAKDSGLTF